MEEITADEEQALAQVSKPMGFVKTSFYTSISTAVTFVCGFIVTKVVALKIGPSGVAMVGQFQNTTSIMTMLSMGAINIGVIKLLSENEEDKNRQQRIITCALSVVLVFSLAVSLFIIFSSKQLSLFAFKSSQYQIVYVLFGSFLVFTSINTILSAVYNGLHDIRRLTVYNICLSITGIIFTVSFAHFFGVVGVLTALNATSLAIFFINFFLAKKIAGFVWRPSLKLDLQIIKKLFKFSVMSAISTLLVPSIQIIVRNKIIHDFSITDAGYWQSVTKISDYYLAFITTVLSVYYLPRLSALKDDHLIKKEIMKIARIVLPVVGGMALTIWLFRYYIILILFSKEFLPMKELFTFQLLGDFIKIASWLLGFLMVAKAMARSFIFSEIFFSCLFVGISFLLINKFGVVGATYGFAVNYLLYFLYVAFVFRKLFSKGSAL